MSNDSMKFNLSIEVDQQSANEARRMVDDVQAEFDKLTRTTKEASDQIQAYFKAPGINGIEKSLLEIEDAAREAERALKNMHEQANHPVDTQPNGSKAGGNGGIGDTAGKAGGFASALAGATGMDGLGIIGDFGDIAEQAAGLGEILPKTASGLASLGVAGVAAGAAVAIAAIAIKDLSNKAQEASDQMRAKFGAFEEVTRMIAEGMTTEEATQALADYNQELEVQQAVHEKAKGILEEANSNYDSALGKASKFAQELGLSLTGADNPFDVLEGILNEAENEATGLSTSIDMLTGAMEEGKFAAEDAANALLDQAASAGDLLRLELEAADASKASNEARLKSLEVQKKAIECELQVLAASGNAHEEVVERMDALRQQMQNLDQQTNVLKTAIQNAGDTAEDSARKMDGATETRKSEARQVEKASRDIKSSMLIIGGMQIKQAQAQAEHIAKQADAEIKAYEDQRKAAIEHNRRMLETIEDFNAKREDLLFAGDFLGAFQQERDFGRDMSRMQNQFALSQGGTTINNNVGNINFPTQTAMNAQQFEDMMRGYARQEIQTILVNP